MNGSFELNELRFRKFLAAKKRLKSAYKQILSELCKFILVNMKDLFSIDWIEEGMV